MESILSLNNFTPVNSSSFILTLINATSTYPSNVKDSADIFLPPFLPSMGAEMF